MRNTQERLRRWLIAVVAGGLLAACSASHFDPPQTLGAPAMVDDGGQPRLWVMSKQEEERTRGAGSRSSRWRTDTFFHFSIQAFDPLTARPLWTRRLLSIGDDDAGGGTTSRVIGSSAEGRLLGQEGAIVWLLIDNAPFAVDAGDGHVVGDAAAIERNNPQLQGLLPVDAKHYAFDQGLVLMSADARLFVVRGPQLQAIEYSPPPPPAAEEGPMLANGTRRIVPMRPFIGEVPARLLQFGGRWLGLYSEKEALDADQDEFGDNFLYPYTILNEGTLARRTFWNVEVIEAQRFDDRFQRIATLAPIAGTPMFLNGRFLKKLPTEEPLQLDDPVGLLVWHVTRIDRDGRLALTRLDEALQPRWKAELPIGENSTVNPVRYWLLPGRVVVMGEEETLVDGVTSRTPHLASIDLADGTVKAWNITADQAVP